MSDPSIKGRLFLLAAAALLIAGCDASSTATDDSIGSASQTVPEDDSTDSLKQPVGQKNVTFYVAEMNEKLGIY
ncbi:MAG: hypothetical protein IIA67_05320 [Planctomycetes bacterium]|nr:hypothetical protein [Planctomycetota bacterium]